jgi:hypothetical protein
MVLGSNGYGGTVGDLLGQGRVVEGRRDLIRIPACVCVCVCVCVRVCVCVCKCVCVCV